MIYLKKNESVNDIMLQLCKEFELSKLSTIYKNLGFISTKLFINQMNFKLKGIYHKHVSEIINNIYAINDLLGENIDEGYANYISESIFKNELDTYNTYWLLYLVKSLNKGNLIDFDKDYHRVIALYKDENLVYYKNLINLINVSSIKYGSYSKYAQLPNLTPYIQDGVQWFTLNSNKDGFEKVYYSWDEVLNDLFKIHYMSIINTIFDKSSVCNRGSIQKSSFIIK